MKAHCCQVWQILHARVSRLTM